MSSARPMKHRDWLRSQLPDDDAVETALRAVFGEGSVVLVERVCNNYASSFPAEILRCRVGGEERLLLGKYGIEQPRSTHGHRSGVAYEAAVYREVLRPLRLTSPVLFGTHIAPETGALWLFLDYLPDAVRADETPQPRRALRRGAKWIAAFHAENEERLARGDRPPLETYDRDYYVAWARRAEEFAGAWNLRLPWLPSLCVAFEELVAELMDTPPTVIHGEFTPHNLLVRNGDAYPVDWESAAIACWAIDLVSLAQKWPARVVRACQDEYVRTRWPDGPPSGFERVLDVARLYWDFRWLGDRPEWLRKRRVRARFPHLRATGRRLGAI